MFERNDRQTWRHGGVIGYVRETRYVYYKLIHASLIKEVYKGMTYSATVDLVTIFCKK
jgi:hypothetical protein